MPRRTAPLYDTQISKAKAKDKGYKLSDGDGMYLFVTVSGGKLWRFDYTLNGKRGTLSIGSYPEISLSEARDARKTARSLVAHGVDPNETRKAQKSASMALSSDTFEIIAREWHNKFYDTWVKKHADNKLQRLTTNIFPWIGQTAIREIKTTELLSALQRIEARGSLDIAHRVRHDCVQVFRYAIATGRCDRNVAADLQGALPPVQGGHHAAPTDPKELGLILAAIDGYSGSFHVKCALQLAPMLFVRPGELRHMEWSELDLEGGLWDIPAGKMKMRTAHLVPLAQQAVGILKELRPFTGSSKYVFPSQMSKTRPISDNTVNMGLRRIGFSKEEVVGHGFRATARTMLDEILEFRVDFIEHQLAHAVHDPNGRAYNRTSHIKERVKMMQVWADYLDEIKAAHLPKH
jgi:integrase